MLKVREMLRFKKSANICRRRKVNKLNGEQKKFGKTRKVLIERLLSLANNETMTKNTFQHRIQLLQIKLQLPLDLAYITQM